MKNYSIIIVAVTLFFVVMGCSFAESEFEKVRETQTPTYAYKRFAKAIQTDDTKEIKSLISAASIEMMEKTAESQNITLDQLLLRGKVTRKYDPKIRNEKIDGDTATIEVENDFYKDWDIVVMVKEDRRWKHAVDKTMEAKQKELERK